VRIKEGIKDFSVGILAITLAAILGVLLILLWPFITVIGWLVIMLLFAALAILVLVVLIMIVGRSVRQGYRR